MPRDSEQALSGSRVGRPRSTARGGAGREARTPAVTRPAASERIAAHPVTPLYYKAYLVLREKILRAEFGSGELFPTEQELCDALGVSRVTIRRALAMLVEERLLRRFQGRGSLVAPTVTTRPVSANILGHLDSAEGLARQTTVELLAFGEKLPPPAIAALFGVAPGIKLHHTIRVRSAHGVPVSHVTTWLTISLGRLVSRKDLLSSRPVLALIEEGAAIADADQTISATLADEAVSQHLRVPIGAPLLEVTRRVETTARTTAMASIALYNPDLYRYRLHLEKPGDVRFSHLYD